MSAAHSLSEVEPARSQEVQGLENTWFGHRVTKLGPWAGAGAALLLLGTAAAWHQGAAIPSHRVGDTQSSPIQGRRLLSELRGRVLLDGVCSNDGEDCRETQCCTNPGSTCFRKNDHWASCNATCNHNYKWENNAWHKKDHHVWDCHTLACSNDGQNCMSSRCCANPGSTCYKKNDHWASCNATCSHNYMWENQRWVDKGRWIWDCTKMPQVSAECDTTECDGCSGEQCQYCRENKERDCCLDDACKHAQGEQVALCRRDHTQTCCAGKSPHCVHGHSMCDTSSCNSGCIGRQCQYCKELILRNCCLDDACRDSEHTAHCYTHNLGKCCEGKSSRCVDQHGPSPNLPLRSWIYRK